MATAQTTVNLILKAQDEATHAIKDVHAELQNLAGGTNFRNLEAQLTEVNQHLSAMAHQHDQAAHAAREHESTLGKLGEKLKEWASWPPA